MKTSFPRFILFVISFVLFFGCQTKQEGSHAKIVEVNGNKVIDCNISEITDTIDLQLSQIVDNCHIVQFETNESSLFESVYHIGISENYIAIHSRGRHPIKLFTRAGKFIRDIGKIGRGPGEFNSLYGIQLDEAANKIYLSPFARATELMVYSLDNEHLTSIPLVHKQTKFRCYVDKDIVTILSMPFEGEPIPIAYQQTTGGKLIQECKEPKHLVVNPRNAKGQFVGFNNEISSARNAGKFDYTKLMFGAKTPDTLYYYNAETNKMLPAFTATFTGEHHGTWLNEWKNHYYTPIFGKKFKGAKVIVDKKTLKSDFFRLKNDFYGGIELFKFFMSNNGWFVASMPAHQLKEKFNETLNGGELKSKERAKIEKFVAQINENDNEVLFVGKMK